MSSNAVAALCRDLCRQFEILTPRPDRPVSELVAETVVFAEGERWDPRVVPYLIRPLDATQSREYNTVVYMGPARTGKTLALCEGRYAYIVAHNPLDTMIVHSSQDQARSYSRKELARLHRFSPLVRDQLTGRASDQNTHDKVYRSGMVASIAWPSNTQLASRTWANVIITDYDRWPGSVGAEGSGFRQAEKRIQTAKSAGMIVVESSPGSLAVSHTSQQVEWIRPPFKLGVPLVHAAPPTDSGARADIASIYNQGTREWWYVPCRECGEYYPQWADISVFSWTPNEDLLAAADSAGTVCCWCGSIHPEETKQFENSNGRWLSEGQTIDWAGKISGEGRHGRTFPSFWQGGGSAAYQTRSEIVRKYLQAEEIFLNRGSEEDLKFVINADVGAPYLPKRVGVDRSPHPLMARAESYALRTVPAGVRFLIAAVDVQVNRFVVQVIGYGAHRQRWVIDRFNITKGFGASDDGTLLPISPAGQPRDWDRLTPLLSRSYPLVDDPTLRMGIFSVGVDSGGEAGVTANAISWWRGLASQGLQDQVRLLKGSPSQEARLVEERYPDSSSKNRTSLAFSGDVPVIMMNVTRYKDAIAGALQCADPSSPGYIHFSKDLKAWWYEELVREKRDPVKGWIRVPRNESVALMVYTDALADWGPIVPGKRFADGTHKILNWADPPYWAAPPEYNPMVFSEGEDPKHFSAKSGLDIDLYMV